MRFFEILKGALDSPGEVGLYGEDLRSGRAGYLVFSPDGIAFHPSFVGANRTMELPADEVVDVVVEGDTQESRRFTVTRLFFLDKYAMAFPKKTQTEKTIISVLASNGSQFDFRPKSGSAQQNYRKIEPYLKHYTGQLADDSRPSMADELEDVSGLYQQGALTEEEFSQAKRQILERDSRD